MDAYEHLKRIVETASIVAGFSIDDIETNIEFPKDLTHGDYATSIAFQLAKQASISPGDVALKISEYISADDVINSVEVIGGFINFTLTPKYHRQTLASSYTESWGYGNALKNLQVIFEHSSPNLFKPFHIGHLVNNSIGESVARLLRNAGADITTSTFPSDVSPGIAKTVWSIIQNKWEDEMSMVKIGEAYVEGTKAYESDEEIKKVIDEISQKIYNSVPSSELDVYTKGKQISLDYFMEMTKRLDTAFDLFFYESIAEKEGVSIVRSNIPKIFEESEGAVVFYGSKYGLFDNVFINKFGNGTYLAKDLGLLSLKFETKKWDLSILITDNEQKPHFELVSKAAELIDPEWSSKSIFLHHGRLRFAEGSISSRLGNVPIAEKIIEVVKAEIFAQGKEDAEKLSDAECETVAIAAIKYSILRAGRGKNIVFDPKTSLSVSGDSGPYLLYAYVRAVSLLKKAEEMNVGILIDETQPMILIERLISQYPAVVMKAAKLYEPHILVTYLTGLASEFNSWYAESKILDGQGGSAHKLAITKSFVSTMKRGLYLLGIKTVERM